MTQQEFTSRTLVEVSTEEFWAINEVYNHCNLDKDEFCKLWRKMNASRVAEAKAQAKAQAEQERTAGKLWRIAEKLVLKSRRKGQEWYMISRASDILNFAEKCFLDEQKIRYSYNQWGGYITPSSLVYDIKVRLNIA